MTNINSTDRLNRASFYVGNDGGAYYFRRDKKRIFWVAEHPEKEYCHIFSGRITGAKINGKFFSLPKYSSKEFGTATFVIEPDGDIALEECTVKFPANLLKVQTLTDPIKKQLPEPVKLPKWQAKQLGNIGGLFKSDRGVVLYVRQRSKRVWMFGESVPQGSNLSPKYAFMFIGTREGSTINGTARSISKGMTSGQDKVTFHIKSTTKLISDGEFKLGGTSWKRRELDYSDEINNYIKKTPVNLKPLGIIERPTNKPKPMGKLNITPSTEGNYLLSCQEQKFLLSKNLSSTTVLKKIKLYPGALVKINKELAKGDPLIVEELAISPKTFTISEHLGGWTKQNPASFKVNDLNRNNWRFEKDAKITWWINNCASKGYFPASDQDTVSEYTYDNKAFAIKANINYSSPSFSLSTQVTHKKSEENVVYNLMEKHVYYNVKVESPKSNNIARWFTPQTQLKEFKKIFNSRTALGYVSDVTYGVIAIFSFQFSSKHSKTDIDAMVKVFTGNGVVSGGVKTSWEKMSSNTEIVYRRRGGQLDTISASQDLKTLQEEISRIRKSFGKLNKNNLPLPIEYTIKSLKTKKTILVGQSVKYNEKSCTQTPNFISLEMQGGFLGYFIVWWNEPDKPRQRKEYNKRKEGWRFIHKFPEGATAIQLEIKARRRGGGKMAVLFNETPELGYNYRLGGTDYPRASLKSQMME